MVASYFDVDGTLIKTNLVHPTVYYMLHQPTPLMSLKKFGRALLNAPQMAWAEVQDRRTFNEMLFASYEGISEDRLLELSREAYEEIIEPAIYPGARDVIARSKTLGHKIVLISGALDVVLAHLAKELGADEAIGNRLEMHNGHATGKLLRPVIAGPTKARVITEHARTGGHDLNECFAYSDSYSDVPMLSVVGQPAVVNPDRRLKLLARAYDWPVLDLSVQK
jgi:HAD superfamily hydrolase (TIGR01490 family)